jgi:hypothetical protein
VPSAPSVVLVRGRQIVERQRELVAKFGEQIPIAVALLKSFESSLALFEQTLAATTVMRFSS